MRVVHVTQATDGGVATVVRSLVGAGIRAGDDVTVVCPDRHDLGRLAEELGARWVVLPMDRGPSWRDVVAWLRLRPVLAGADVAHLHSSKAGVLGRLAARSLRSARPGVVFTPHAWSWFAGGRATPLYRWIERWLSSSNDVITVVSGDELTAGRAVLGPDAPFKLVENGVDLEHYCVAGEVAPRPPGPLLVQVGRLSVQKAQDRSIRALARLKHPGVRLRLVGEGPERSTLLAQAQRENVSERVEFIGNADPRPHLRAADVVLLPSRWEGLSLAMLEAMAMGRPIVASDCGGSGALEDCGCLVDHMDDEAAVRGLVDHVDRLLSSPEERAELGRIARRTAELRYPLSRTLDAYREVWEAAARRPPRATS